MKIVQIATLTSQGKFARSKTWRSIRDSILRAVREVDWPRGSGTFTIYAEAGKERGKGNGVKPIIQGLIDNLRSQGWEPEKPLDIAVVRRAGKLDAVLSTNYGPVALEWETGNISSSHRALNRMALGLLKGCLAAGVLIVPSRNLYRFLTDRIGNITELEPYFDLWRSIPCESGVLEIVVVEHDATSLKVPRIPKGTEGRSLQ